MKNIEFLNSLKSLVIDQERAEQAYKDILKNRYNMTSSNSSLKSESSASSGNIQEIAYEQIDDDRAL